MVLLNFYWLDVGLLMFKAKEKSAVTCAWKVQMFLYLQYSSFCMQKAGLKKVCTGTGSSAVLQK